MPCASLESQRDVDDSGNAEVISGIIAADGEAGALAASVDDWRRCLCLIRDERPRETLEGEVRARDPTHDGVRADDRHGLYAVSAHRGRQRDLWPNEMSLSVGGDFTTTTIPPPGGLRSQETR